MRNNPELSIVFSEMPLFKRSFVCQMEPGVLEAIYTLAKTYTAIHNFTEAIAWVRVLAEREELTPRLLTLLLEVAALAPETHMKEEAEEMIAFLQKPQPLFSPFSTAHPAQVLEFVES